MNTNVCEQKKKKGKTVESVKYQRKHDEHGFFLYIIIYTLIRVYFCFYFFGQIQPRTLPELRVMCMYLLSCMSYPLHGK